MSTPSTTTWHSVLYSGGDLDSAERSYCFSDPIETIKVEQGIFYRNDEVIDGNPWDCLKAVIGESGSPDPEWVGYIGYEMGAFADRDRPPPYMPGSTPDLYFQRYRKIEETTPWEQNDFHWTVSKPLATADCYVSKIEKIQEHLRAGDIYQMCLSHEMELTGEGSAFSLFCKLAARNPAPFSAYLDFGDMQVISSSPERFLRLKNGELETRPIKGTAPRGKTAEEDETNRQRLLTSEKERAELLMITDLMRSDLGRVSETGVRVDELCRCEAYANVFHLLSVIRSKKRPDIHPVDALRACFPAGSISGCPKLRAQEIIADIEGRRRGVYTGAIGYFCGNGDFDFSVAIRTLVQRGNRLSVQLGGAITIASDPMSEYNETLYKGETILDLLLQR